jgi:hypothetical protein
MIEKIITMIIITMIRTIIITIIIKTRIKLRLIKITIIKIIKMKIIVTNHDVPSCDSKLLVPRSLCRPDTPLAEVPDHLGSCPGASGYAGVSHPHGDELDAYMSDLIE